MSRFVPNPPAPQTFAERQAEDRGKMIHAAMAWVTAVDRLARAGKLDMARASILSACVTIVRMKELERYWLVHRCIEDMATAGFPVDEKANHAWLKQLRDRPHAAPTGLRYSDGQSQWEDL